MFAKSNSQTARQRPTVSQFDTYQWESRSLRVRIMLWYGLLVAITIAIFAILFLTLTTNELYTSAKKEVYAQIHSTRIEVQNQLRPQAPYWPAHFDLTPLDAYNDPGIAIEIIDNQGTLRYDSDQAPTPRIPLATATMQSVLTGNRNEWTTYLVQDHVQVVAIPIYATQRASIQVSSPINTSKPPDTTMRQPGIYPKAIGILIIAKSLNDEDRTTLLLHSLLMLSGGITLFCALLAGWGLATRVLRPLSELVTIARNITAATIQGIPNKNLRQRIKLHPQKDELAQVIDTFNEMLAVLEQSIEGQRRFIADASHELHAPLTIVQGNLAFLQMHSDELPAEECRDMISDAYSETLRLAHLVDDLLLLARADAQNDQVINTQSHVPEKKHIVEVDHVLLNLVRQFRLHLQRDEMQIFLQVGHIDPVRIYGDEESLRRLLLILLDNAVKYTLPVTKQRIGQVIVSINHQKDSAMISVHDTGIGIAQEDISHIFERFYRTDRARSRQGTGLGLAIATVLTEQLGGTIHVESTLGEGSTFSIYLPTASMIEKRYAEEGIDECAGV